MPLLTKHEYTVRHERQSGICAICLEPETSTGRYPVVKRLAVDHDHSTGNVRGLLCNRCNIGLGYFKDSTERLLSAAAYLITSE